MRFFPQRFPGRWETLVALGASALWSGSLIAGPALPIPCAPGTCGAKGASQFVTGGAATAVATQNALTVNQSTNSAILNWSSFNIGANGSVTFKQPGSSSIALNRIFQGSPSQIFGQLNANGQVYLINLNGFLFGPTSTINVGSLLVSSLPLALTDANFANGILSPLQNGGNPVLDATLDPLAPGVGRISVLDVNGNPVLDANGKPVPVQIVVQPGAQMTAADQGRILLAGQSVTNGGTLTAPDGQVVLAAGTQVFLAADSDPTVRGLIVEVDVAPGSSASNQLTAALSNQATGTASNQATGTLSAPRGNITMVGLAVNQDGRISATTSVSANGSIRLEAADGATIGGSTGDLTVSSSEGGTLTIGPQSQMEILPELSSSATAVAAQTQYSSSITLLGQQVSLQGGSIVAPGGNLTAIAAANPSDVALRPGDANSGNANARLNIDSGTSIDLSGSDATLPVTANLVSAQLRSTELADDPTQRNGALHGLTVYVDDRDPPPATLANVSGEIAGVAQTIAQRTETGGTAVFESEGDVAFAKGASVNVSGGSTTYLGGVMQTTYLVGANGQLYPIATANPLLTYVGVLNPTFSQTYDKWGVQEVLPTPGLSTYQPGYVEGASAGSVQFAAPTLVLQGSLQGSAVNGLYQRTPSTSVAGGQLIVGLPAGTVSSATTGSIDYLSPAIELTTSPTPLVVSDNASPPSPLTLQLPVSYLTGSGFTSTQLYGNYGVTLPVNTPLVLPSGSTLSIDAARIDVLSSITDPAGTLNFQNMLTIGTQVPKAARSGVFIGDGVTLDVRGQWTNDMPSAQAGALADTQTWQNGGSIDLGVSSPGALLSIADDVTLRVSGGAWLNSTGTLVAGTGGTLTLNEDAIDGGFDLGNNVAIDGFGVNGAAGGTFNFTAPRVEISSGSGNWATGQQVDDTLALGNVFQLRSSLFSNYGFEIIDVAASGLVAPGASSTNVLSIDSGTAINATVSSLNLVPHVSMIPSSTTLDGIAAVTILAPYQRPAAAVSFTALPPAGSSQTSQLGTTTVGDIFVGAGASVTTDAGGAIDFTGLDSIIVDGVLRAPGGTVSLHVLSPGYTLPGTSTAPYSSYEAGFLPNQRIELGPTGKIDVSGTFVSQPSSAGLDLGTVYAGGSVNLLADRGAVVADAGSSISIAGTDATQDVLQSSGSYAHQVSATAGGSITVHSGEAISLLGGIDAGAGAMGTTGAAAAGSLEVDLTQSESWWGVETLAAKNSFNQTPLTLTLLPSVASTAIPSAADSNQAFLGATQLSQWGIDALRLEVGGALQFSGDASLALGRQLIIDAPVIGAYAGAQVNLSAPYLEVGYEYENTTFANTASASGGTGSISFSGAEIDLVGTTAFQGASNVSFTSSGDLLLRGVTLPGTTTIAGQLAVAGNLTLDAARIYPTTATSFIIDANDTPGVAGSVTLGQTSADPGTPLSAGGALTISADSIASSGSLYAPFGSITLNAAKSLMLADGSLTSVSGDGLQIPYGETQLGETEWIYGVSSGGFQTVSGVPTRSVSLTAPAVTIAGKATIDLQGGGDLSAFEWVPGTGGTTDALAPGVTPGLYAILPSTRGQVAPQDPQDAVGSGLLPGESVFLSGGGGLAAGTYPLLPARYALQPGAYLIQIEPQLQSATPGSLGALANGTSVVAGFLSYGATGLHQTPGYVGFAVYPGSYGSELATYDVSLASNYFSALATTAGAQRPNLPADAGSLSIAVTNSVTNSLTNSLNVSGQVLTAANSGGLGASIDISANDLIVGTAAGSEPADAVSISSSVLNGWQPGSLLLGGTSSPITATTMDGATTYASTINVVANSVTIGTGTALTADQIVLVANQSIDVQSGAILQSTSASTGTAPKTLPMVESVTLSGASGATPSLLAVSDLNWLTPMRTGGTLVTGAGTVGIDTGASIASRGSLSIDGTGGVTLNGSLSGVGAEWSLGSASIAFVPAGSQADTLSIDPALTARLGTASAVRLASTNSIDLLTPVTLGVAANGTPTLESLTLVASSLNNLTGAGSIAGATTSEFGAQTLILQGSGASVAAPSAGPTGAVLSLAAGELDLGPNNMTVNGFGATRAAVSGAVIGEGSGGLSVGGDLALAAAGVTVSSAADTAITATGALSITPAPGTPGKMPALLGGALSLSGQSIDISGAVAAPSGIVTLAAAGDLTLSAGGSVSTAGTMVDIGNQSADTPGGSISMTAGGNLSLGSGASVNVAGAGAAAGGTLSLMAADTATIGATLSGGSSATGGSFSLDAGSLSAANGAGGNALSSLAAALGTGGFNDSIDLRVRTGDLDLSSGSVLVANAVTLTADTGQVTIGGDISATSAALRGALAIFGGAGVELIAGGALHADGVGTTGLGGTIEIGTGELVVDQTGSLDAYNGGTIRLDAGSTISAAGMAGDGTLLLRAPALVASNEVAIPVFASNTSALGQIIVEPVMPFNTATFSSATSPTAADFAQVQQTVTNYMTVAGTNIASRLAPVSGTPLVVEAGVEIIAPGSLTLPALDLSSSGLNWNYNGAPIDLTVRAAGNLEVAGTITDGFTNVTIGGVLQPALLFGPSSSIRLVAGADLSSANPLNVVAGGTADLMIDSGAVVRTGTGTIDLAAARDILLEGQGSGAYTAGTPDTAPDGTAATTYSGLPRALGTVKCYTTLDCYGVAITGSGSSLLQSFPTGGGNLVVSAGRDISYLGGPLTSPGVTSWQLHEGGGAYGAGATSGTALADWGVNLDAYDWNFGTLGGGDLVVTAGRDVLNVTAAAANSLLPQYAGSTQYVTGGGLSLTAGRNIGSAQVFLADGTGSVVAGGGLTAILPSLVSTDPDVGSAFYLQSSAINVTSRLGMVVDGIFNPTAINEVDVPPAVNGDYLSYSGDSALSLQALTGDIVMGQGSGALETLLGQSQIASGGFFNVLPANLTIQALGGNIDFGIGIGGTGVITLYPSSRGQLDLLAAQNIQGDLDPAGVFTSTADTLGMSDAPAGSFASVANPLGLTQVADDYFDGDIHAGDTSPALVTAGLDISEIGLSIPKAATIVAGQDLSDVTYSGQNLSATDQTVLMAGRDVVYLNSYSGGKGISVGGPGTLDVLAGRNVSLGTSPNGVVTTGNLLNPNLPTAEGADLTIATGLGTTADYSAFLTKIIEPSAAYQAQLVAYVESLQGSSDLTVAGAEAAFANLSTDQQRPFIDQVFFNELSLSGLAANATPAVGFSEGYAAIDTLFPGSRTSSANPVADAFAGDLTLEFSRIYTLSGGDINLLVPGGLINVGLAVTPALLGNRPPSSLGIVTEQAGNINIYTKGDVNVNASRIFTLGGGNILIWSDEGSIDAGQGAKTSISAPPPSILINSDGTVSLDFSGAATGSGIRTIQTEPTTAAGNVDLIAPVGTVDAGDAGIGAAGDINIAARSVIGATNINFGGTAAGVPALVSNISASLSGASNAAGGTSNASTSAVAGNAADKEAAAPLAQTALSWLDVFVTGLGEENCKPDDIECLKRQKTTPR